MLLNQVFYDPLGLKEANTLCLYHGMRLIDTSTDIYQNALSETYRSACFPCQCVAAFRLPIIILLHENEYGMFLSVVEMDMDLNSVIYLSALRRQFKRKRSARSTKREQAPTHESER